MLVQQAHQLATAWVMKWATTAQAAKLGYRGAYLAGSMLEQLVENPTGELPTGSDIDIMLALDAADPPPKPGKFLWRDTLLEAPALLEASFVPWRTLADPANVLGDYHLAPPFRGAPHTAILHDPQGALQSLTNAVAPRFAQPEWVLRRSRQVRDRTQSGLQSLDVTASLQDRMMHLLFGVGGITHLFLVAALRNPTVRRRYTTVRAALAAHGYADQHEELLTLLGSASTTQSEARALIQELATTFDLTAPIGEAHNTQDRVFASDISVSARAIAIDGTHAMIDAGEHREALFWIAVTFARCHHILAEFAPAVEAARRPALEAAAETLNIAAPAQMQARAHQTLARLPHFWQIAQQIAHESTSRQT